MSQYELDYSLRVHEVEPDGTFPRISFPGVGKKYFSVEPYSDKNFQDTQKFHSTQAKIQKCKDGIAVHGAFLFAQGFNQHGVVIPIQDVRNNIILDRVFLDLSRGNNDAYDNTSLSSADIARSDIENNDSTIGKAVSGALKFVHNNDNTYSADTVDMEKLWDRAQKAEERAVRKIFKISPFTSCLACLPNAVLKDAGELLAQKVNEISVPKVKEQESLPAQLHRDVAVKALRNDSVESRGFESAEEACKHYTPRTSLYYPNGFSEHNDYGKSRDFYNNGQLFAREEIMSLFRKNMSEKDFIKFNPLIEKVSHYTSMGDNMAYFIPFFIAVNEFLGRGKKGETFVDFFLRAENKMAVSNCFTSLDIPVYKHTEALLESISLPGRIMDYKLIESPAFRRAVSESSWETIYSMTYFSREVVYEGEPIRSEQAVQRVIAVMNMMNWSHVFNDHNDNRAVATTNSEERKIVHGTLNSNEAEGDFFIDDDDVVKYSHDSKHMRTLDLFMSAHNADNDDEWLCTQLAQRIPSLYVKFLYDELLKEDVNVVIEPRHMIALSFVLYSPKLCDIDSRYHVSLLARYALRQDKMEQLCALLTYACIFYDNLGHDVDNHAAAKEWREAIDASGAEVDPFHVISLTMPHSKRIPGARRINPEVGFEELVMQRLKELYIHG